MKRPKISLDTAKLKELFLRHCEKLVLVGVAALVVWFIYSGFKLPGLEEGKTPHGLLQTSQAARTFIDEPTRWQEVAKTRPVDLNITKQVELTRVKIDAPAYHLPRALAQQNFPKLQPRRDPQLFPPINVVVRPIWGPLAVFADVNDTDPLMVVPMEEETEQPKKKPKKKKTTVAANDPLMGEGYGPSVDAMGGGARNRGRNSKARNSGDPLADAMGPGPGMDSGGYGASGTGTGEATINPESRLGFVAAGEGTIARDTKAMVIMAAVPFEKQHEEFQDALANSLDYDPQRDNPFYLKFWIERADVTDDPAADPAKITWAKISVDAALLEQMGGFTPKGEEVYQTWAGTLTEIVDQTYLDQNLTHPAPPFMQRDSWDLLKHPDVPLAPLVTDEMTDSMQPRRPAGDRAAPTDDLPTMNTLPGQAPGGMGPGGFGPGGFAPGGSPGSMMPGGAMGGSIGGSGRSMMGAGSADGYRPSGGSGRPGLGMGGSRGMGGEGGFGGGAMGSGMGSGYGDMMAAPPKYKLVRFTDTTVEQGKHYRYRVKVLLHDPNHPRLDWAVAPSVVSLDPDARKRIKDLDQDDAKKGPNYRTHWVESEWSEPSPVVTLPPTELFYAGTVTPASTAPILGRPVPTNLAKAKALTVVWDRTKVVDVPAEKEVVIGAVLNFVQDVEVIHPVFHSIVPIEKYPFVTGAIVADMRGGEEIPEALKNNEYPLTTPGEVLFFDASGNFHVQHESDDIEDFRRFLVQQPEVAPIETVDAGGGADGFQDILGGGNATGPSGGSRGMRGPGGGSRGMGPPAGAGRQGTTTPGGGSRGGMGGGMGGSRRP